MPSASSTSRRWILYSTVALIFAAAA